MALHRAGRLHRAPRCAVCCRVRVPVECVLGLVGFRGLGVTVSADVWFALLVVAVGLGAWGMLRAGNWHPPEAPPRPRHNNRKSTQRPKGSNSSRVLGQRRTRHLSTGAKLTNPQMRAILIQLQNGICPTCRRDDQELLLDHDHNTGKVRGALCDMCNGAEGGYRWGPGYDVPTPEVFAAYRANPPAAAFNWIYNEWSRTPGDRT